MEKGAPATGTALIPLRPIYFRTKISRGNFLLCGKKFCPQMSNPQTAVAPVDRHFIYVLLINLTTQLTQPKTQLTNNINLTSYNKKIIRKWICVFAGIS
jgi:hypothetical protein